MKETRLEALNNYMENIASKREISFFCGEDSSFKIDINALNDVNKINMFIDEVVQETYVDISKPNYFFKDIVFMSYFLKMFTDLPIPSKETDSGVEIDISSTYNIIMSLNIHNNILMIPEVKRLYDYIDKQIEFENFKLCYNSKTNSASDEAIETFNIVMNSGLDAVTKICDILDNFVDLSKDGKFLKVIPKKRVDAIFAGLQKVVNSAIITLKQNGGENTITSLNDFISKEVMKEVE